jgi:hypothetical protein
MSSNDSRLNNLQGSSACTPETLGRRRRQQASRRPVFKADSAQRYRPFFRKANPSGKWKMSQEKAGVSDRDLSIALQEVPASQAMENGVIMPEVGHQ